MKLPGTLKNTFLTIRDRFGLSFASKGLGYLAALLLLLALLARYKLPCYQTTLLLTISVLADNTLLKTTYHFLLLLVGFNPLTYRKDYDRSPILVGHQDATENLFWSQFSMPKRPLLLKEQMAQWAELHRILRSAMKDVVVQLWLTEPVLNSYFGLVQRLVDAVPCIDVVKRSTCIEGARMALARVKTYWARYCSAKSTRGQGPSHARALFWGCPRGCPLDRGSVLERYYVWVKCNEIVKTILWYIRAMFL